MGAQAVFLVGFMASGKTSVGQELARRLHWGFTDLDVVIESREAQSIPEIFRERGETGFRLAETSALQNLIRGLKENTVVALGGGAFAQEVNRDLLRPWPSVFLETPVEELWNRCLEDATERPLRKNRTEFEHLYHARLPLYREALVTVVTSGRDPVSLSMEIVRILQLGGSAGLPDSPPVLDQEN